MTKRDINNPNDYEFKAIELCIVKGCTNPVEWWFKDNFGIGLCYDCYKELEEEHLKHKDDKMTIEEERV